MAREEERGGGVVGRGGVRLWGHKFINLCCGLSVSQVLFHAINPGCNAVMLNEQNMVSEGPTGKFTDETVG